MRFFHVLFLIALGSAASAQSMPPQIKAALGSMYCQENKAVCVKLNKDGTAELMTLTKAGRTKYAMPMDVRTWPSSTSGENWCGGGIFPQGRLKGHLGALCWIPKSNKLLIATSRNRRTAPKFYDAFKQ